MRPPEATEELNALFSHLHPMDDFYAAAGLPLPEIERLGGEEVPEPYRALLVHEGDMTPTLKAFHRSEIHLQVLRRAQRGESYFREVVLRTNTDKPVEYGAIKIHLAFFPPAARKDILEERFPLGHLLALHHIPHLSRPKAYLRVRSDSLINRALGITGTHTLYGRRNTLLTPNHQPLAEIVEILPPATA